MAQLRFAAVDKLAQTPLVWALVQGTCLGGNITMIGSTANIVALGMLEKRYRTTIHFFEWLKIGVIVGVVTCLVAWGMIALLSPYMPTVEQRWQQARTHTAAQPTPEEQAKPESSIQANPGSQAAH